MPKLGYTLCFGVRVTSDELGRTVEDLGGSLDDAERGVWSIEKGDGVLWILRPRYSVTETDYDGTSLKEIESALGARPVAFVSIESRLTDTGSSLEYLFAARCMEQWPCVMDDNVDTIYTFREIIEILQRKKLIG